MSVSYVSPIDERLTRPLIKGLIHSAKRSVLNRCRFRQQRLLETELYANWLHQLEYVATALDVSNISIITSFFNIHHPFTIERPQRENSWHTETGSITRTSSLHDSLQPHRRIHRRSQHSPRHLLYFRFKSESLPTHDVPCRRSQGPFDRRAVR